MTFMTTPPVTKRSRGRPRRTYAVDQSGERADLSREHILHVALEMTRSLSLADISFVQIARQLDVSPGSVHYYVGTRDELISAVMNRAYRVLLDAIGELDASQGWQAYLGDIMSAMRERFLTYPGIGSYIALNAEYRVFQSVDRSEIDYGRRYLDHMLDLFRRAGFRAADAAICVHLTHSFVLSVSYGELEGNLPSQNRDAMHQRWEQEKAEPEPAPGLVFGLGAFATLDEEEAFRHGVSALINEFDRMRQGAAGAG